jgi:hypothetical protein
MRKVVKQNGRLTLAKRLIPNAIALLLALIVRRKDQLGEKSR